MHLILFVDIVCAKSSALNGETGIDFYSNLAKEYGDKGILDIGCGTGCIMMP